MAVIAEIVVIATIVVTGFLLPTIAAGVATATTVAINSTFEVDVSDENLTAEEFEALNNSENVAFDELDVILDSIQTMEGLDEYEKCGYSTEMNPYKVLDCYEKNKEKIK